MKKAQIVLATQNNVVNMIPLMLEQFSGCTPIILSSEVAKDRRWTANLEYVLQKKGFEPRIVDISDPEGQDPKLMETILSSIAEFDLVYFNISGGKKNQILPLLRAYQARSYPEDRIFYADSNPFRLQVIKDLMPETECSPEYHLDLENILNLHGFTCCYQTNGNNCPIVDPGNLSLPQDKLDLLNRLFLENDVFAKLLYSYFDRMETDLDEKTSMEVRIKSILSEHRPKLPQCQDLVDKGTKTSYDQVAQSIKNLKATLASDKRNITEKELNRLWRELSVIPGVENIFSQFWGAIRDAIISMTKQSLEAQNPVLISDQATIKELQKICEPFGWKEGDNKTEIRNSDLKQILGLGDIRKGSLFEAMLSLKIWQIIKKHQPKATNRLFMNVKAYKLDYDNNGKARIVDRKENENLVEFDTVFVTSNGTLLTIESKTFGHSGDMVKSKTWSATSHAGIFSKAVMVTHIQKKHRAVESELARSLPNKVIQQLDALQKYSAELWYYDEIEARLERYLNLKTE